MTPTNAQGGARPQTTAETVAELAEPARPENDQVILAQAVLDAPAEEAQAPDLLLPEEGPLGGQTFPDPLLAGAQETAPLETAAGQPNGGGGGASVYQSDFGSLIDGLQASDAIEDEDNSSTPGNRFGVPTAADDIEGLPATQQAAGSAGPQAGEEAGPQEGEEAGPQEGEEAGEEAGPVPELPFVPPLNPVGPGADQALFTRNADNIDFNGIDVGGYLDGTQYDADRGNDIVVLPGTAREALDAGFTVGNLFDAGKGNDQVTGGDLADLILGNSGHDLLIGAGGDDSLWGGSNNDSLDGGLGNDLLDGGGNNDSLDGGAGNDTLLGGSGRNVLLGGGGDDSLVGGSSRDTLDGGDGDDSLVGGSGRDMLDGGLGNDLLDGGGSFDSLNGGDGDDSLLGGNQNDTLSGDGGNDSLWGGGQNDILLGGSGDDMLFGDGGRDTLAGGSGDDTLSGGNGRDSFSFSLINDEGTDLILDFDGGRGGDSLQITDLIDVNLDSVIDIADLDAGGHSVSGNAGSVIIDFAIGTSVTLEGINGTGVNSFADLLDMKINVDIA
jgi:Ca2+-binding RTX toxin-like protein